jgi:hypothetical protein
MTVGYFEALAGIAVCTPGRSDQIATRAATSHCRAFGAAPPICHSALAAPVNPPKREEALRQTVDLADGQTILDSAAARYRCGWWGSSRIRR